QFYYIDGARAVVVDWRASYECSARAAGYRAHLTYLPVDPLAQPCARVDFAGGDGVGALVVFAFVAQSGRYRGAVQRVADPSVSGDLGALPAAPLAHAGERD